MYPKLYIYHLTLFTDSSVAEKYSNVSTVCVHVRMYKLVLTCKVTPGNSGHRTTPDIFSLDAGKSTRDQVLTFTLDTRDVPSVTFL